MFASISFQCATLYGMYFLCYVVPLAILPNKGTMWLPLQSRTYLSLKYASFPTLTLTCVISLCRSMEDIRPRHSVHTTPDIALSLVRDDQPSTSMLKRPPSPSFEGADEEITRKRFKEDSSQDTAQIPIASMSKYDALVDDLAQELQCGCCAGLVYRPVVVSPCQHFFCGRYSFGCRTWSVFRC